MEEDSELIAEVDEEEDVDKEPDQPSEPALCFPVFHFHDRRAFSDNGHLAFIGVLEDGIALLIAGSSSCLLYTSPSPRDKRQSRMPSSA